MKWIVINPWQVGLVYKNDAYRRMLKQGRHWLNAGETVITHWMNTPLNAGQELDMLLQDEALRESLHVVTVKDDQLVLVYENGLLKQVLTAGRHAYWKGLTDYRFEYMDISKPEITEDMDRHTLAHRLISPYVRSATVSNHEKGVLFIDGKYVQLLEPGVYHWWAGKMSIEVVMADTRQLQVEINGQEILTKDKATLRVNAWAQYHLSDIGKAMLQVKDYERQLHVRLQLSLRETIGALTLDELMDRKSMLDESLLAQLNTSDLGVTVNSFGIRDIILPGDMRDIMNQVLMSEKKAQANIIMRREETASTRSLLNTAKLMEDNPMLFKLKEMEYVEKIAEKIGSLSINGDGGIVDGLEKSLQDDNILIYCKPGWLIGAGPFYMRQLPPAYSSSRGMFRKKAGRALEADSLDVERPAHDAHGQADERQQHGHQVFPGLFSFTNNTEGKATRNTIVQTTAAIRGSLSGGSAKAA
ncbi:slipin family protein [Chitinophaga horti]|uniref:Slipin family protein n=1 Tax=Chitinophaga horti TaxID=2920382 RepID=A0ABY6J366_9BACT|nr:slipin family protein [Chitinophaga horti]UYQ92634.1 slipin family protein [Chitinophaga horti]